MKTMTSSVITNRAGERLDYSFHSSSRRDVLVLLGHGLTGNKDRPLLVALAEGLAARGWPCMRFSCAGNGNSEGDFRDVTLSKAVGDLQAILRAAPDWVRVAYAGHSMGAAAGVLAAAKDLRLQALVSLAGMAHPGAFAEREFSGLTPGVDCIWDNPECPLSEALVADLKTIGSVVPVAATVPQPWLLIHGGADDLVPVQDGRDLYAAAPGRKQWLEIDGAGHSFDEATYPQIIATVDAWLTTCFGTSADAI